MVSGPERWTLQTRRRVFLALAKAAKVHAQRDVDAFAKVRVI
jgi:hypothetical protein